MRKILTAMGVATGALALSACSSGGLFDRDRPDEFAVSRAAPLVVPPDFALTPPRAGAPRPQDSDTQQDVLEALFGGKAPRSPAQNAVTTNAGSSEPGIRSTVGDPETNSVNKGSVTRDIISAPEGDGQNAQAATPGS